MVLRAAGLGEEPLGQLLQVAAVIHLDFCLLPEEVLQVLQQLHSELTLLVQTLELLHQLGPHLCVARGDERDELSLYISFFLFSAGDV